MTSYAWIAFNAAVTMLKQLYKQLHPSLLHNMKQRGVGILYESVIEREERVQTGTNNNCYAAVFISDSAGEEEEVSDVITHDALIKLTNISQLLHCCPLDLSV